MAYEDRWTSCLQLASALPVLILLLMLLLLLNPITHGIFTLQVPRGGGFHQPPGKPPKGCFCPIFFNPAKLLYNCRSHAKGESQEFKIEEIEEL